MSKANSNFDHLIEDEYGDKKVKGTYYTINKLEDRVIELEKLSHEPQNYRKKCEEMEERIDKLEAVIDNFMNNWGPQVQEARSRRDEVWDEMVRVVSIQKKHQQPEPGYDIHGNKWPTGESNEENH